MLPRSVRITLGTLCLFVGLLGLLLPFLPGWLFLLLVPVFFFPNHPRVESVLRRLEPRVPRLVRVIRRIGGIPGRSVPDDVQGAKVE